MSDFTQGAVYVWILISIFFMSSMSRSLKRFVDLMERKLK